MSDKLLKSSATRLSLTVARSRILRFPHSESSDYFAFLCWRSSLNPANPAACKPLFRVSGGAL
ncbi:hypothetical protein EKS39_18295 [Enterobacter roggenkampii]|nr:hypothetical protein EKS39_18295 [Enterobacter roggenkampii]RTY51069.1 hypothetical protein EKS40_01420 [Enterobacter roggenkampii]